MSIITNNITFIMYSKKSLHISYSIARGRFPPTTIHTLSSQVGPRFIKKNSDTDYNKMSFKYSIDLSLLIIGYLDVFSFLH